MGRMKTFGLLFGFEWWGRLRPAEMTTPDGQRLVPLFLGLWIRWPLRQDVIESPRIEWAGDIDVDWDNLQYPDGAGK